MSDIPDPERRNLEAEPMLALRLRRMRRLSADKYIDDTLLTQAEYQLFLNESRAEGHYYQPDHWLADHFPPGQGLDPVAGVRASDAHAFCEWLTAREQSQWAYRLPQASEADENQGFVAGVVGYWLRVESGGCILAGGLTPTPVSEAAERVCARALAGGLARDLARIRDLADDLILTHTRALTRDLAGDLARARAHVRDLTRASDLASVHQLARDLDLALAPAHIRARALDRAPNLDLIRAHTRARTIASALASVGDLASDLTRVLEHTHGHARFHASVRDLVRTLDRACDHAHALARAHAASFDHTPILALDLGFDLDHDVTGDRDRASALALARVRDCASTRASALDLDRAHDVALALGFTLTLSRNYEAILTKLSRLRDPELTPVSDFLRGCSWYAILRRVTDLWASLPESNQSGLARRPGDPPGKQAQETWALIDDYLDLYVDLALLEARIKGELPATEGIRLVRERQRAA